MAGNSSPAADAFHADRSQCAAGRLSTRAQDDRRAAVAGGVRDRPRAVALSDGGPAHLGREVEETLRIHPVEAAGQRGDGGNQSGRFNWFRDMHLET